MTIEEMLIGLGIEPAGLDRGLAESTRQLRDFERTVNTIGQSLRPIELDTRPLRGALSDALADVERFAKAEAILREVVTLPRADTSQLEASLEAAAVTVRRTARTSADLLTTPIFQAPTTAPQTFRLLADQLRQVPAIETQAANASERMAAAFRLAGEQAAFLSRDTRDAVSGAQAMAAGLGTLTIEAQRSGQALRETAGARLSQDLRARAHELQQVGLALSAAVTAPLVAAAALSIHFAAQFETAMAQVRKSAVLSASEVAALAASLKTLSEVPGFEASDALATLAAQATRLGVARGQLLGFVRVVEQLATATDLLPADAARGLSQLADVLGGTARQFDRVASAIVAAQNAGAGSAAVITEVAGRIAGAGNVIGLSADQVIGFAAAIARVVPQAQFGGNALERVMLGIAQALTDAKQRIPEGVQSLANFGRVAGTTSQEFARLFRASPAEAITRFVEGLGRLKAAGGDVAGALNALGLADVRVAATLLSLASAGAVLRDSLQATAAGFADADILQRAFQAGAGTTEQQLRALRNALRNAADDLGTALLPLFRQAVAVLQALVIPLERLAQGFAGLPTPLKIALVALAGLVAAIGPLLLLAGSLTRTFAALLAISRELSGVAGLAGLLRIFGGLGALLAPGGLIVVGLAAVGLILAKIAGDALRASLAAEQFKASLVGLSQVQLLALGASLQQQLDQLEAERRKLERQSAQAVPDVTRAPRAPTVVEAFDPAKTAARLQLIATEAARLQRQLDQVTDAFNRGAIAEAEFRRQSADLADQMRRAAGAAGELGGAFEKTPFATLARDIHTAVGQLALFAEQAQATGANVTALGSGVRAFVQDELGRVVQVPPFQLRVDFSDALARVRSFLAQVDVLLRQFGSRPPPELVQLRQALENAIRQATDALPAVADELGRRLSADVVDPLQRALNAALGQPPVRFQGITQALKDAAANYAEASRAFELAQLRGNQDEIRRSEERLRSAQEALNRVRIRFLEFLNQAVQRPETEPGFLSTDEARAALEALDQLAEQLRVHFQALPPLVSQLATALQRVGAAAGSILRVADALGVLGEGARQALAAVEQLAVAAGQVAAGDIFGGALGLFEGAVNFLGGILGGGGQDEALRREIAENTIALREATNAFKGLSNQAAHLGDVARALSSHDVQGLLLTTFGGGLRLPAEFARLEDALKEFGLSFEDLQASLKAQGLSLLDEHGRLTAQSLELLNRQLHQALIEVTQFGESLAAQRTKLDLLFRLEGATDTVDRLRQDRELLKQLFPDQAAILESFDLTTAAGQQAFRDFLLQMFHLFEEGFFTEHPEKLRGTIQDFESIAGDAADALNSLQRAANGAVAGLTNVPTGFKLAAERFKATLDEDADRLQKAFESGQHPFIGDPRRTEPVPVTIVSADLRTLGNLARLDSQDLRLLADTVRAPELGGTTATGTPVILAIQQALAQGLPRTPFAGGATGETPSVTDLLQQIATRTPDDLLDAVDRVTSAITGTGVPRIGEARPIAEVLATVLQQAAETRRGPVSIEIQVHAAPGQSAAEIGQAVLLAIRDKARDQGVDTRIFGLD